MRSSDLARLANVSVRTLRHYHQIGLLPEPERSANGYRVYTASDLVRVLRARRLADLGVPLSHIDPAVDVRDELALLDEQYARQIDELRQRRAVIRELLERGSRADTPAFADEYLAALTDRADLPPRSVDAERDAALLLDLVLGGDGASRDAWRDLDAAELAGVTAALYGLADDASDERIEAVAARVARVVGRVRGSVPTARLGHEVDLALEAHVAETLTPVQLEAVRRARLL